MNFSKALAVLLTLFCGSAIWTWYTEFEAIPKKLEQELLKSAEIAATLVDPQSYQDLITSSPISREKYKKLLHPLLQFHKSQPKIAHIYSISKIGDEYYSILDTSQDIQTLNPQHRYTSQEKPVSKISTPDHAMEKALRGTPSTEKNSPNRSQDGANQAHYIPIMKNGEISGVLALTMSEQEAHDLQKAAAIKLITTLGLYSPVILLCSMIILRFQTRTLQLQKSKTRIEEQFKTLTERMPGALYVYSTRPKSNKGALLFLSPGAKTLLKITPQQAETDWKEITDMLPAQIRTSEEEKITDARQKGMPWECEFRLESAHNIWIQNKAVAKKDENGNTIWFGSLSDVTLQKNEALKLGETNSLLKNISEAPNEAATLNTICEFASRSTGKSCVVYLVQNKGIAAAAGSLLPQTLISVLQKERTTGENQGAASVAALHTNPLHVASIPDNSFYKNAEELRDVLLKEGFLSTTLHPLITQNGECLGVLEVLSKNFEPVLQITPQEEQASHFALSTIEKHKGLKEIEENEKKYRKLFEESPIAIIETDLTGNYVFSNRSFKETLQDGFNELFLGENAKAGIKEIKTENKTFLAESISFEKKQNQIHLITFLSNITEQKLKEERAITSKEVAEAANVAKSEFLAVMSHEIRTPLNGILGFAALLKALPLETKPLSYINKIQKSGETLLTTINDILNLSKIEAGKIDFELLPFDYLQAIEITRDILMPKVQEKNILLETIEENIPKGIIGDETRIRQILVNLAGNAVKFTDEGKVTIRSSFENDTLTIKVSDTGIGISPENQKRLFKPFSQADSSTTRKYGGTGLGLVICKKLTLLMGGTLLLESEVGTGTTFTVTLPIKEGVLGDATNENQFILTDQEANSKLNILVAEDDEINTLLIQEILRELGHETKFAKNGLEAFEMAQDLKDWADLILMDMRMPVMDGLESTKNIRNAGIDSLTALPIYALTANALDDTKEKCLQAGMNGHISKPIDIKILKMVIRGAQVKKKERNSDISLPCPSIALAPIDEKILTPSLPPPASESFSPADLPMPVSETLETSLPSEYPTNEASLESHLESLPPSNTQLTSHETEQSLPENNLTNLTLDPIDPSESWLPDTLQESPISDDWLNPTNLDPKEATHPTSPFEENKENKEIKEISKVTQPLSEADAFGWGAAENYAASDATENATASSSHATDADSLWGNPQDDPLSSFEILNIDTFQIYIDSMGLDNFKNTIGKKLLESCQTGLTTLTNPLAPESDKRFIAHKLRGSMGTLGFLQVMELTRRIEENSEETYSDYQEIESVFRNAMLAFSDKLDDKHK